MARFFVIVFLIFVTAGRLFAQATIAGEVYLEDGAPAAGAFVTLLLPDSVTMKKFTAAGADGKWVIKNVPHGDYLLNVRYLGCEELFRPVTAGSDSLHVVLRLKNSALLLQGVEVRGQALGITRSGDTLKFNLKHFSTGAEITLGDVLNQLPGIEVDDSGDIKYAGKRIDKLLVQGKDILNNKRRLATETIRSDQLAGVNIINDYRENTDIDTKKSGKTALNVRLKKKHQNTWSGTLAARGGYQKKWLTDWAVFNVGDRIAATLFARANNAGEPTLSFSDYMSLKGSKIFRSMKSSYSNGQDLLPKAFLVSPKTTENLDGLVAGAIDWDVTKHNNISADILFANIRRNEGENFIRHYFASSGTWQGRRQNQIRQPILSASLTSKNKVNNHFSAAISLNASYEAPQIKNISSGIFNNNPFDLNHSVKEDNRSFAPEMKIEFHPNKKSQFKWQLKYSNELHDRNLNISDIDTILGLNLNPVNGLFYFDQKKKITQNEWNSILTWSHDLKKAWYWGVEVENTLLNHRHTYFSPVGQNYSGSVGLAQKLNTYRLFLRKDTSDWLIKMDLSLLDNFVALDGHEVHQRLKLRPNFSIRYSFSKLHFLLLSLKTDENVISPSYGGNVIEAVDSRQEKIFDIDWPNTGSTVSVNMNYLKFKQSGGMLMVSTTYSVQKNVIGTNLIAFPNHTRMELIRLPRQTTFSSLWSIRKRITTVYSLKLSYNLLYLSGFSASENKISDFNRISHGISFGFNTFRKKGFNYSLGDSWNLTSQKLAFQQKPLTYTGHQPYIKLSYAVPKGYRFKTSLSYNFSRAAKLTAANWLLDTDLSYKPKASRLRWTLKGKNLLNLRPARQISLQLNQNYSESVIFHSFPGYIMGGLSYEF